MNRNSDLRSQSLDMLRFPLAVVVLIVHTIPQELILYGNSVQSDNMPILLAMRSFVRAFLTDQSVPVYFFISGFVFFLGGQLSSQIYVRKMKNRFKSLFIPYIIWNIIALLSKLAVFLLCLSFIFKNAYMKQLDVRMSTFLYELWDASKGMVIEPEILSAPPSQILTNEIFPAYAPLWFVRDLMIVAISTPVLYWLLKRTRHYMVLTLGLLWFYSDILWGHANQLITAYFFFSFGAYMSINGKDMLQVFGRYFKVSILAYFLLGATYMVASDYYPEACDIIKKMNVFAGLLFAYNLAAWLLQKRICKVSPFLASSSFFIYVSHGMICIHMPKLFYLLFHPMSDVGVTAIYILSVVITLVLLLSVYYLMRRFTPKFLKVITGRK